MHRPAGEPLVGHTGLHSGTRGYCSHGRALTSNAHFGGSVAPYSVFLLTLQSSTSSLLLLPPAPPCSLPDLGPLSLTVECNPRVCCTRARALPLSTALKVLSVVRPPAP